MRPSPSMTRHLIDPEITSIVDSFPSMNLSAETLPTVRQDMSVSSDDEPDPVALYPNVTTTEMHIPGAQGDPDVRVLYYEPKRRRHPTPALVWMHGGGFVLGPADDDEFLCRRIADHTGAVVASVDYRLAPETTAPGQVEDSYAALRWLDEHAEELGVDRSSIAVGGASAGGGLAASLAILARDRAEVPVSFQLLIYPSLDDRTGTTTHPSPYAGEFIWTAADNGFAWEAVLGQPPGSEEVSPYAAAARTATAAELPPAFIAVGSLDLFVEENLAYAARLLRAGVPTELHIYPGAVHMYDFVPESRLAEQHFRDVLGALDRRLNG